MDRATYLARVREQRFQAEAAKRVGRGAMQKNRLLDDADQNIGNAEVINPQPSATIFPDPNPPRILNLDALAKTGMMTTVSLSARAVLGSNVPVPGTNFGGPIIGIVEFGNGSVFTRVEVDVPIGPITTAGSSAENIREPEDGGTILSVPTGTLRVYGRNDGNLLPTTIDGSVSGVANGGANDSNITADTARSVFVKAQADYAQRAAWRAPTRTVICFRSGALLSQFTFLTFPQSFFLVPPFSKRVRILRAATAVAPMPSAEITFFSSYEPGVALDRVAVAAAAASPLIDVPGHATWFNITTGDDVLFLAAQFEIGL